MGLRLNLGCGKDIHPGFVNVDFVEGDGVDVVADLDETPWPWADESVDEILAFMVFEHVNRFDAIWREVYRVLRPGGEISIRVAYGNIYDPFHHSVWKKRSIRTLMYGYATSASPHRSFRLVQGPRFRWVPGGFPWWHARKYLGINLPPIPLVSTRYMFFTLKKVGKDAELVSKTP